MVYRDIRWICPRDGCYLDGVRVGTHSFMRCARCWGAFLEPHVLGSMLVAMGAEAPVKARALAELPRQLHCPSCEQPLSPLQLAGVLLDGCPRHGIWFDRGELEAVLEWAGLAALARK